MENTMYLRSKEARAVWLASTLGLRNWLKEKKNYSPKPNITAKAVRVGTAEILENFAIINQDNIRLNFRKGNHYPMYLVNGEFYLKTPRVDFGVKLDTNVIRIIENEK